MAQTPHDKGAALEVAVHAIESAILNARPGFNEKTFHIESNKIISVSGVRHEIDIWVSVELGEGAMIPYSFSNARIVRTRSRMRHTYFWSDLPISTVSLSSGRKQSCVGAQ